MIAHEAFDLINGERDKDGLSLLVWDNELEQLAIKHSQYMSDTGDYSHSQYNLAENILELNTGYTDGGQVYTPWRKSFWHNTNMRDGEYHYAAIGIVGKYATFLAR